MVGIFFELRDYAIGALDKSAFAPLIGTLVPHHPMVAILWCVIMTVPLCWFWVRALTVDNYRNAFCALCG